MRLPRVARNKDFRETQDVGAVLAGFLDEGDNLLHRALKVEPGWFCLYCSNFDLFTHGCYFGGLSSGSIGDGATGINHGEIRVMRRSRHREKTERERLWGPF